MTVPTDPSSRPTAKPFWSIHTHSRYSFNDAMPQVPAMVAKAVSLGYPALALTDHGNISGSVQLYKACRKAGIEPLPGMELYMSDDRMFKSQSSMHLTVAAYSGRGYTNLVRLNNRAIDGFFYKPKLDMADLAIASEEGELGGLMVGTGCYFGIVQQTLLLHGAAAARQIVEALAQWFPKVVVELHQHGVPRKDEEATEEEITEALCQIADEVGVPVAIAADAHYLEPADQHLHDGLKQLVSWSEDPSEAQFPGGPYCLLDNEMLRTHFDPALIVRSGDTLAELAEAAHVRIPELEQFQLKVPDVTFGKDPNQVLTDLVYERAAGFTCGRKKDGAYIPLLEDDRYAHRVREELDTIIAATMPGYVLLVTEVTDWMTKQDIWFHTRGSATGSLVMFLLGVTQHDPIRWGLRMDRFMGRDRTRPPDVDLDVEHLRRAEVVAWLEKRFSTRQVGNIAQYSVTEEPDENGETDGKGSLMVKYQSVLRKQGRTPLTWEHMPRQDRDLLLGLAKRKLMSGYATHAAGYIVAPDENSVAELPLARIASRKANVTAYAKKDVEAMGFCKLDLLGLKTKSAARVAAEAIHAKLVAAGEADPFSTPLEWYSSIPENDKATLARIGRGDTEGMFQLSGKAMARGVRDMKPRSVADLVAAQALYRPAMFAGKLDRVYMERRRKKAPVPERHADIMEVTKDTYGIALYQEQVIDLCRRIGMTADELTDTLDAVKASNDNVAEAAVFLASIKERVHDLAVARGWSTEDVDWLVDSLAGYADYSFNKAHSVAYGVEAYRTAYLAEHYPLEFWAGVLTAYTNSKLEIMHVRHARKNKVVIRPPHVNHSGATYTIHGNSIRKGLLSVKGVGDRAAEELVKHQPYVSLVDLGQRVSTRIGGAKSAALRKPAAECGGVIAALEEANALDGLA